MSELKQQVITKAPNQVETLIDKHWDEIQPLLTEDGEVTLSFKTKLTLKDAKPGDHADKSDRIRTTLSFSSRVTDSAEAQLTEDSDQEELPLNSEEQVPV